MGKIAGDAVALPEAPDIFTDLDYGPGGLMPGAAGKRVLFLHLGLQELT
jgi:hypothetical protein